MDLLEHSVWAKHAVDKVYCTSFPACFTSLLLSQSTKNDGQIAMFQRAPGHKSWYKTFRRYKSPGPAYGGNLLQSLDLFKSFLPTSVPGKPLWNLVLKPSSSASPFASKLRFHRITHHDTLHAFHTQTYKLLSHPPLSELKWKFFHTIMKNVS